jgi:hypothetical protein
MYFHLSFQIYGHYGGGGGGGKWLTLKIMYFIIRPTCSSYDYEREKKSKSEQKRTRNASD